MVYILLSGVICWCIYLSMRIYKLRLNNVAVTQGVYEKDDSVWECLLKNIGEGKGYYETARKQSNIILGVSVGFAVIGIIFFGIGIVCTVVYNADVELLTIISGSFFEALSAIIMFLYKSGIKQMSEYHKRMMSTEKYLMSFKAAEEIEGGDKIHLYNWIIQSMLLTDREIQTGMPIKKEEKTNKENINKNTEIEYTETR